jgi:hypothetical protein
MSTAIPSRRSPRATAPAIRDSSSAISTRMAAMLAAGDEAPLNGLMRI